MKKLVLAVATVILFSSCSVRLYEEEKTDPYYNTIHRGMETHNFVVLSNQNEQILANQKKILENQEKIIQLLQEQK